jgi:hypothetical protein
LEIVLFLVLPEFLPVFKGVLFFVFLELVFVFEVVLLLIFFSSVLLFEVKRGDIVWRGFLFLVFRDEMSYL